MKKFIVILLFLSSWGFAQGPLRHRSEANAPDAIATQATTQDMMEEMKEMEIQVHSYLCDTLAKDLISAARCHIGARYKRGSIGPKAFDCSGFTSYVFKHMGIMLKRSSQEQNTQGEAVQETYDLLPGDLVFFGRGGKTVNHVGIVTNVDSKEGTFTFIHASTSRGVRIDSSTDDYWISRYAGARRIIGSI